MSGSRIDLPFLLRRAARCFPDAPAVEDRGGPRALAPMVARAERFANALDEVGVPPGAPVALLSGNRREYPEVDSGIVLGRRVRLALNARLHLEDHRQVVESAGVRALVHSAEFADEAARLAEEFGLLAISLDEPGSGSPSRSYEELVASAPSQSVDRGGGPEDPAWITYTSGTTGRPKGIVLSHRAIREVALNLLLELPPIRPGEQIVLTQPLSHGASYFVLPYLIAGAGVYIVRGFDPEEVFAVSRRSQAQVLKLVPAMLPPLLELGDGEELAYSSIVYGASPISRPLLEQSLERFGPVLMQVYGQSEAPVTLTCLQKEDHLGEGEQRFSVGRPWRSVAIEVRGEGERSAGVDEVGEVVVSGSHMMSGYHQMEEETGDVLEGGWLRTRDMGRFDERGFLYLLGRRDEMINSGGFNVAPREVEVALTEHPAIEEAAVVGTPDARWGSAISALVRARGDAALSAGDVVVFARERLGFRGPRRVVLVEQIPKTSYGKVDREAVLAALADDAEVAS
jgi:fatty-acyl-CoA synthase